MKFRYILILCSLFIFLVSHGQGYKDFNDYKASKEAYYQKLTKNGTSLKGTGYKDFQRSKYFQKGRVGKDGNFNAYVKSLNDYYTNKLGKGVTTTIDANWSFLGPIGLPNTPGDGRDWSVGKGMVTTIYVDPTDHNVIYAGASRGGLWRTTNGGNSWQCLTHNYYGINGIKDILVDPNNSEIIYILTGYDGNANFCYSNGIFKSTDGGNSWFSYRINAKLSDGSYLPFYPTGDNIKQPRKMIMDPDDSNIIYLVTYAYVLKTSDGGSSWSVIHQDEYITNKDVGFWNTWGFKPGLWDIAIVKNGSSKAIYVSGYKIIRSLNDGNYWTDETSSYLNNLGKTPSDTLLRMEMSSHPNYPSKLWFFAWFKVNGDDVSYITKCDNVFSSNRSYNYLTGSSINDIGMYLNLEVSPNDENIIYVSQQNIKKFNGIGYDEINCNAHLTDKNVNYVKCTATPEGGPNDPNWIHPDIRDMIVLTENGEDVIFTGDDGGVSRSVNQTPDLWEWKNISDNGACGLYVTEFYGIAGIESDPDLMVGGCQDLSNFVYDNGTWQHSGRGDGGLALIDYSNPSIMYVLGNTDIGARVVRYRDRGINIDKTIYINGGSWACGAFEMHPTNPTILYHGWNALTKITNATTTMDKYDITPNRLLGSISALGIAKSDPDIMYAFSDHVGWNEGTLDSLFFKTTDGGNSWTDITPIDLDELRRAHITSVVVSPENANELWIGFSYDGLSGKIKVLHSTNGGASWTILSNNLPTFGLMINELAYDYENRILYAATDVGILLWDEVKKSWFEFTNCLPKGVITDIVINNKARKIRASVFGHGIWEANLWFCPNSASPIYLNGTVGEDKKVSTHSYMLSTENTNHKNVTYESGDEIVMPFGFTAYDGFTAVATTKKSCNTGCDNSCIANLKKTLIRNAEEQFPNEVSVIESEEFSIYPNPSDGRIMVEFFNDEYSQKEITITSITGEKVFDISETAPDVYIDISGNPPGVYIINIIVKDKIYSENLIIK